MNRIATVARALRSHGFEVQHVSDLSEDLDGEITVDDRTYVQIGSSYACVVRVNRGASATGADLHHVGPMRTRIADVLADLRDR